MSKSLQARKRRRLKQSRNLLLVVLLVIGAALLAVGFLIVSSLKPTDARNVNQITPGSHKAQENKTSMGVPGAPVKVDVWEDFQCSGCLAYTQRIEPQIIQTYVETGKVYYTFHIYPFIDGGQGESHDAANAAMCASAQDRFWDYHDMLFANWKGENAGSFTPSRLDVFARDIGLDMTVFNRCIQEKTYSAQIQQDMDAGTKLGVPPTPAIFVNGKMVVSSAGKEYVPSFDDISRAIETALSGK
jgi:protein-disulfide isomerase